MVLGVVICGTGDIISVIQINFAIFWVVIPRRTVNIYHTVSKRVGRRNMEWSMIWSSLRTWLVISPLEFRRVGFSRWAIFWVRSIGLVTSWSVLPISTLAVVIITTFTDKM